MTPGFTDTATLVNYDLDTLTRLLRGTRRVGGSASGAFGCDIVAVAAHKATGLEWDNVRIGSDFYARTSPAGAVRHQLRRPGASAAGLCRGHPGPVAAGLGSLRWIPGYR